MYGKPEDGHHIDGNRPGAIQIKSILNAWDSKDSAPKFNFVMDAMDSDGSYKYKDYRMITIVEPLYDDEQIAYSDGVTIVAINKAHNKITAYDSYGVKVVELPIEIV
jgi:hypothetical protein